MEYIYTKSISTQVLIALKEALTNIYWRKQDIRQFIELTIENSAIVSTIDWQNNPKYESISQLIDRMAARKDIYFNDLIRLAREASNFSDFSHLKLWEESEKKILKAKEAVEKLRAQTKGHFDAIQEVIDIEKKRKENQEKVKNSIDFSNKLDELKTQYLTIATNQNFQQRGYQLEALLNSLFILFDLNPKASFKIVGEQIDGAFTFDNHDYLLEAKWHKEPINAGKLYEFSGKIQGKLKNTLGLFVALEGYSKEGLEASKSSVNSMILMDGFDLMTVLDARISLPDMLYIKRRHASQTGEIFHRIN